MKPPIENNASTGAEKFRELIVYLSRLSEGDDNFGSVKLNKLLFYIDFMAYTRWGRSVTGKVYQKLEQGPAPRPLVPVLRQLEEERAVALQKRNYYGLTQKRPVALREPVLSGFAPEEIDLIHYVVDKCRHLDAKTISDQSHRFTGWKIADLHETIPYEIALIGSRSPTTREEEIGRELDSLATACLGRNA
ncbi:MAG: Panacea domain-containing protein [Planctomycetota bacterium]|nr:SocA family protein [Planctomycetaceae bacterium]MDQ3329441.1 Panacea domain-containing protein [Planctomycetota bacterium]